MIQDTFLYPKNIREPRNFPSFTAPKIIGSFSLNENRVYIPDKRNCKYLRKINLECPPHFDLNEGYERAIHKSNKCENEKLDHILQFIIKNLPKLKASNGIDEKKKLNVDLVCYRGLLRMIMCTPYENREPWIILASKFMGTIYLCALETEDKKLARLNETNTTKKILSYGFKFEQYMLTGK